MLTVTSVGEVPVSLTVVEIHMTVIARGKTALAVQKKLLATTQKILNYLALKKASKFGVRAAVIHPTYSNFSPTGSRNVTGYAGSSVVQFEADINRISTIFNGNVLTGATGTLAAGFKGSYVAIRKARLAALYLAIKTARKEAHISALAAGRRVGRVVNIQFGPSPTYPVRQYPFHQFSSGSVNPAALAASSQPIRATVTVTFATY